MDLLQVLRIVFGFPLVLFIPGFALTLALWPKTKKEVSEEIVKVVAEKKPGEVCFVGSSEEQEDLLEALKDKFEVRIYDIHTEGGKKRATKEEVEKAKTLVLTENLDELDIKVDPEGKTIIDLASNFPQAIAIEDTIDIIERIALSFGLSIAIVPLLGLILNYTPFGIRLGSIFTSLILVIALFFGVYYYRRKVWITSRLSSLEPT
jgi:hypothetical protein